MGIVQSIPSMASVALVPLEQPVSPFHPRLCEPRQITLRDKVSPAKERLMYDASTGATRLIIRKKAAQMVWTIARQWLYDGNNVPIATFDCTKTFAYVDVHAGTEFSGPPLYEMLAKGMYRRGAVVRAQFRDVVSGQICEIGFEGNWANRDAILWLDRGRRGERLPVAKITRMNMTEAVMDVAPNMDPAVVVLAFLSLAKSERRAVELQPSSD